MVGWWQLAVAAARGDGSAAVAARGGGHEEPAAMVSAGAAAPQRNRWGLVASFVFLAALHALVQALCLGTAAMGIALSRPLAGGIVLAAACLAVAFARAFRTATATSTATTPATAAATPARVIGPATPAATQAATPAATPAAVSRWSVAAALVACGWAAWTWIQLWALTWQRPDYDWDGLYYHLPAMNGWAAAGRVCWIPGLTDIPFANGYPMAAEVVSFLVHRLTGTSRLVDASSLWFWPLGAVALAVLAQSLGARGAWRWVAAGAIAWVPTFAILSATCYVEPAFACAVFAALAASTLLIAGDGPPVRLTAVLWGLCCGLMLGVKGLGLPFFLILAVLVLPLAIARRASTQRATARHTGSHRAEPPRVDAQRPGSPRTSTQRARATPRRVAAWCSLGILAAVLVGGYWYARDLLHTGNPLYPVQVRFGARVLIAGYDPRLMTDQDMPDWLRHVPRPARMPWSWLQTDAPIRSHYATGGLGWLWPAGGLVALVALWRTGAARATRLSSLALLTVFGLLALFAQPAAWWARFTLWLHGLGLPALAALLHDQLRPEGKRARAWTVGLVAVWGVALAAVGTWESATAARAQWQAQRVRDPITAQKRFLPTVDALFAGMSQGKGGAEFLQARHIARSPWSRMGTLMGGVLALPLDQRHIEILSASPTDLDVQRLQHEGVEWVIWDVIAAGDVPAALQARASENVAFHPATDVHFALVRLAGDRRL
jgi:hypothetical protein